MNATPREIANAHSTVYEIADGLVARWAAASADVLSYTLRGGENAWRNDAHGTARAKLTKFQTEMLRDVETSLQQLGVTATETTQRPEPPLPKGWNIEQFGKWAWAQFSNAGEIRGDITQLIQVVQTSNRLFTEGFFATGDTIANVSRAFEPLRGIADAHFERYVAADEKAMRAEPVEPKPARLSMAAGVGISDGVAAGNRTPQMPHQEF
jgi:hypothetical protein